PADVRRLRRLTERQAVESDSSSNRLEPPAPSVRPQQPAPSPSNQPPVPGNQRQTPDNVSSGSFPVLPPMRSTGTAILSISVTSRFAIVGLSVYARWRPPLSVPAPPPMTRIGRLSPE